MSVSKDQIIELLGSGLTQEQVSIAVGCDQSYISQLLSQEEVAAKVSDLRMLSLTSINSRDRKIDSIEDRLIAKLDESIEYLTKPRDILTAFTVLNNAKRRGNTHQGVIEPGRTIVNLNLPNVVINNFVKNVNGEVIEVEGQTLVSMPAGQLLQSLSNKVGQHKGKVDEYAKAARFLPSGATGSGSTTNVVIDPRKNLRPEDL